MTRQAPLPGSSEPPNAPREGETKGSYRSRLLDAIKAVRDEKKGKRGARRALLEAREAALLLAIRANQPKCTTCGGPVHIIGWSHVLAPGHVQDWTVYHAEDPNASHPAVADDETAPVFMGASA